MSINIRRYMMRGSMIMLAAVVVAAAWWPSGRDGQAAGQVLPPAAYNVEGQVAGAKARWASGALVRVAVVGDSIAFRPAWHQALRDRLAQAHGGGGYGWRGINPDFKYTNAAGASELTVGYAGSTSNIVKGKGTQKRDQAWGIYTPDGIFSRVRLDGSCTVNVPAGLRCVLHYLRFPGGGVLKVYRSGVLVLEVPTDGAAADQAVELPAGTKYRFQAQDDRWVQVNALDMVAAVLPPGGGIVIDRFARGNDNPAGYGTGNTASTAGILAALDEDLLTIETDWVAANPQSEASFIADVTAYIGFVRSVNPDIGIILIAHHQTLVDLTRVSEVMYQIALDQGCGFIDHRQAATHDELVAAGYLMPDEVHLSAAGGVWFAERDAAVMGE